MKATRKTLNRLNLLTMIILSSLSVNSYAEEEFKFNDGFIMGKHSKVDLSKYTTSGLAPGVYSLDVYTNGIWKGRYEINVAKQKDGKLGICYDKEMLGKYGISAERLNKTRYHSDKPCGLLAEWSNAPEVNDNLNKSALRLDISVPQIYEDRAVKNYVAPEFWDKGITALNIGWNGNVWNSHYSGGMDNDNTSGYLGVSTTAAFNGWALKNRGSLAWSKEEGGEWTNNQIYLQKPIGAMKSIASFGQIASTGEFFDSVTIRGVNLKTDDSMLPDGMLGFAPEIRGVAQTNALVTIKQSGSIVYQTTVSPGPFILKDVYPYGYGNNLEVSIKEADGTVSTFTVPYNSSSRLIRPGLFRYELTAGKADDTSLRNKPIVYQGTMQYGVNNTFTTYIGVSGFTAYQAYLLGSGVNTPIGGLSLDVTASSMKAPSHLDKGRMYRLSYNKTFEDVGMGISLSGAKYDSRGFYSLNTALLANDSLRRSFNHPKSEYTATLSQQLPEGWGGIYSSVRLVEHWDDKTQEKQYQVSYNNRWGKLSYSLMAQRINAENHFSRKIDDRVSLSFSYPLSFGDNRYASITSNTVVKKTGIDNTQVGLNGSLGSENNISYGVNTYISQKDNNVSLNGSYRSPWATLNGSYSQSKNYYQNSLGGSGTLVIHSEGLTLSPETGDTLALVKAKNAEGGKIVSSLGSRIDSNGFAIVSSLRPYKVNAIEVDPKGTSEKLVMNETVKHVVPVEGGIVKVNFETEIHDNLIVKGKRQDGKSLPFGATIYDASGKEVGVVGQGGMLYIKNAAATTLTIKLEKGECKTHLENEQINEVVCS